MASRRYAQETTVSVTKSQQELSMLLQKAGADQVLLAWDSMQGTGVRFRMGGRFAQLMVPPPGEKRLRELKNWRPRWSTQELLDQEQRRSWRALILLVKAKLEAIAAGITTAEREFMPDLLMEDGRRLEEWALPTLESRRLPALTAGDAG
jgi:hypothetical protein